ncbi:hypothetical protein KM620_gp121 [Hyposidra talaca nucleopolyhedrovirus]|uniref:Uncharacterized protein n=1 Tax=Hyposidra talaca nucleopolyhedrovirus TaxID=1070315 RepID=A0A2Z4HI75_9ABAC|nr:hypothetical protein KM620_gp121 [Hyposidra talaca nucleopolyhedrovirus]AWW14481.1 hypothetical protein HytaNPV_gp121 [Hyposidra talaca nucleopolyhedrovirus]
MVFSFNLKVKPKLIDWFLDLKVKPELTVKINNGFWFRCKSKATIKVFIIMYRIHISYSSAFVLIIILLLLSALYKEK